MPSRTRLADFAPNRFASGWRLLPTAGSGFTTAPRLQLGNNDIVFDLVRPSDLVSLAITLSGCEMLSGDGDTPAVIRRHPDLADDATALLAAEFAYQHAHEQAVFEAEIPAAPVPNENDPSGRPGSPPPVAAESFPEVVDYRPGRATRLVFVVPAGAEIPFTTAGVLHAIGSLDLVLHNLAGTPGDGPQSHVPTGPGRLLDPRLPVDANGEVLRIGEGLVARFTVDGPVIDVESARDRRVLGGAAAGDLAAASNLVFGMRKLRSARAGLAASAPVITTRVDLAGMFDGIHLEVPGWPGIRPGRRRGAYSRPPTAGETAIEAPFRLIVTPPIGARWAHADSPVASAAHADHVELWHTRLASTRTGPEGDPLAGTTTEGTPANHTIRAIWARDRDDLSTAQWRDTRVDQSGGALSSIESPSRGSLTRADRHRIVRQTAERWPRGVASTTTPHPVAATKLWLSSLGSWLDLHGAWDTKPYSFPEAGFGSMASILAWDHVAPMGRDQYVRVVYPGYLYPLGHQCVLVKITQRKMSTRTQSVAGLYQRKFLVVTEPVKHYSRFDFPFKSIELRPTVTPNLADPGPLQDSWFWPTVSNGRFPFELHGLDQENRAVTLSAPLIWVAEHLPATSGDGRDRAHLDLEYDTSAERMIAAQGLDIAFTPARPGGDSILETEVIRLRARAGAGTAVPFLSTADVRVPAVQRLSPIADPITITYFADYRAKGFADPGNPGEIWAKVRDDSSPDNNIAPNDRIIPTPTLAFGTPGASSEKSGGFVAPSQPIRALSTVSGPVGDIANMKMQKFDPVTFLAGASPRLFGLVNLVELVQELAPGALDRMPSVVSEALGRVEQLLSDLERARGIAERAVTEAERMVQGAKGDLVAEAAAAKSAAESALAAITDAATTVPAAISGMAALLTETDVTAAFAPSRDAITDAANALAAASPLLTPFAREQLAGAAAALRSLAGIADIAADIMAMLKALDPAHLQVSFRYEWTPLMKSWPSTVPGKELLKLRGDSLRIAVDGRVSGDGGQEVRALAELRDFELILFPGQPLVRIPFGHMSFKSGSAGKAEVDVVLGEIEFLGMLSFVETIKDLIPFDGFSDPPYLDVTPAGLTAGFTLALPSLAIGVFTLANMSLGADVHVPFLGKTVSVGFNFCTRERPFTLAVVFLGGGGWFGIRLSPRGLDLLELGLEAGACLSVDFGVASGSISAMIGIYMRLEGEKGSLTGYFRLRGEVDVLGLISASIELYLELVYSVDTGKMKGRAIITVQVKVLFFSGSVKIEAERQFAGSNGDPSFREVMCEPDGSSPAWDSYCLAFQPEGA